MYIFGNKALFLNIFDKLLFIIFKYFACFIHYLLLLNILTILTIVTKFRNYYSEVYICSVLKQFTTFQICWDLTDLYWYTLSIQ